MHCEFPGTFGFFMNSLARFGVPLFFSISGFFLYYFGITKETIRLKLRKRIIKILSLLLFSFAIYFLLGLFTSCFGKNSISVTTYLKETFHWKKLILLVVCNDPLTNGINWFMIALLFSYFIIYLFPNLFLKHDLFLYIISSLTVFWIIFRIIAITFNLELFGFSLMTGHFYQSWYACGLLFVSLGMILKKKSNIIEKIPTLIVVIILFASLSLMVIEQFLLKHFIGTGLTYNFGSIGSVFSMITLSLKKPNLFSKSKLLNIKGNWTTFVYIFHQAIIICLSFLFSRLNIHGAILDWTKPVIVLALTIGFGILFNYLIECIKKLKSANL